MSFIIAVNGKYLKTVPRKLSLAWPSTQYGLTEQMQDANLYESREAVLRLVEKIYEGKIFPFDPLCYPIVMILAVKKEIKLLDYFQPVVFRELTE